MGAGIIAACSGGIDSSKEAGQIPPISIRDAGPRRDAALSGGLLDGCDVYSPGKVYALGTLTPSRGSLYSASVELETGNWCGIVNDTITVGAALRPDGRLLLYTGPGLARVFMRDRNLYFDDEEGRSLAPNGWRLEEGTSGADNDTPVSTGCSAQIAGLLVFPDTGAVAVNCLNDTLTTSGGTTIAPGGTVFSLGFAAHVLAMVTPKASAGPRQLTIFDATGLATTFPEVRYMTTVLGVRARADGFLAALFDSSVSLRGELWHLGFDGKAAKVGEYAVLADDLRVLTDSSDLNHNRPARLSAMAADGTLYQVASKLRVSPNYIVIKRPLAPATVEVAYDATSKPVRFGGDGTRPEHVRLVTGP